MSLTMEDLQGISEIIGKMMDEKLRPIIQDVADVKQDITSISLHIENVTDNNICLLAENHGTIIDKLNQAIRVADKTAMYEIQVSVLSSKVEKLEKEMTAIKSRIA